ALDHLPGGLDDVDVITTPWDVSRLRRTCCRAALGRFALSLCLILPSAHEPQDNEIVLLNRWLKRRIQKQVGVRDLPPLVNVSHHDAHAAIFFVSPFEEAVVLVMDGFGDDASTSAYIGRGNRLERLWHTEIFNSIGIVYTFVTKYLGF